MNLRARQYWFSILINIFRARHADRQPSRNASPAPESTAISPFNFEGKDVRVITIDGEPWFVGSDVAGALGYTDSKQAVRDHCKVRKPASELKGVVSTPLHSQTILIREPDVYRLVTRSKLPSADRFERWVSENVLEGVSWPNHLSCSPQRY